MSLIRRLGRTAPRWPAPIARRAALAGTSPFRDDIFPPEIVRMMDPTLARMMDGPLSMLEAFQNDEEPEQSLGA